ncbi:MAG: cation transporter [bacterium]|nr:MAG: cation transporter [bacterium]
MLERIIEWSVKNKFLVMLATAVIIAGGLLSLKITPLDAIPDLSDVQVIIFTEYPGQAPQVVEDQVTYPLTTAMLAVPYAETVRGYSFFGFSFVYIIFEDGTDLYWARSRVLEYLNFVSGNLPQGITPALGPDATGVGWIYEYALVDRTGKHDLAQLRSIQDWYLRYELQTVSGVSEVASVGGFVKQYQVEVDPNQLFAYDISLKTVRHAIKNSNTDVGGRLIEMAETEFMVRGRGYIKSIEDIEDIAVGVDKDGTPVLIKDVANVQLGPELRRGLVELDGEGEVAGGVVIMRFNEDALKTIELVKAKLEELKAGLPEGVEIVPTYDRSALIHRAVEFLKEKLLEEAVIVTLVCILFLMHLRSAFVAIFTLPVGVLMAFIVMGRQGINANIMSLGGIAIAIGAMVDAAIVMIENTHKHLERDTGKKPHGQIILDSVKEVGPPLFFCLLIITVSFLPVFALQAQEGRLFKPLAFTKTYSMASAAILSITLVPVMMGYFVKGEIIPERKNPINIILTYIYQPLIHLAMRAKALVVLIVIVILAATVVPFSKLGSEFMPPLMEGDILYMPSTLPGISITKAKELLQQTDKILKTFPEVVRVFGKAGRAETATDPAPPSMIETVVMLKPPEQWRPGLTMTKLMAEMNEAIKFPGVTNAWTMPIKTRIDMLATGIKTPVGIKIAGDDLSVIGKVGIEIESILRDEVPGTLSVYSERVVGGNYLDFDINRKEVARYGLLVGDVQEIIQTAIGGMNVTETVEGLERYPVNVRYKRELRDNVENLKRVLVTTPRGEHIPLAQLTDIRFLKGPPSIKSENARLNGWIYVDLENIDVGTYVKNAQKILKEKMTLPQGISIIWSGQYEYMERAKERLKLVVPVTLLLIFLLLYMNFNRLTETLLVMLSIPFALIGSIWLMYFLGYNISVAVGVGMIALSGVAAEIGVLVLLYINHSVDAWIKRGAIKTRADFVEAVIEGAVERLRPIMMTAAAIIGGLLPIMWGTGTGAMVMKRIATPMVGGMVSTVFICLVALPVLYVLVKQWKYPAK